MRHSISATTALAAAVMLAGAAGAQQIQQAPLAPLPPTGVSDPPPAALPPPAPRPRSTQMAPTPDVDAPEGVRLPTPVEQTDCLNQAAAEGNYMPTPAPAPGTDMPMEYRLPLGKREVPPTH